MADTITQACKCCEIEDDCIEGLCQLCRDYNYEMQKKIDLLTLGILQEKNKVQQLQAKNETLREALEEASHMIYGELYHDHPTFIKVKEALKENKNEPA